MSETKPSDPRIRTFWQEYLKSLPQGETAPSDPPQAWHFMDEPDATSELEAKVRARIQAAADELGALVVAGIKTATASLEWTYAAQGEAVPQTGDLSIITNWAGEPLCLIRTTQVRRLPFNQVDAQFAYDEGEGDRSLEFWRRVHWEFFSRECAAIGRQPAETMPVICERFEVIYRHPDLDDQPRVAQALQAIEEELEAALVQFEQTEDLEYALKAYWGLEARLLALELNPGDTHFQPQQRVLAAVLMREANILRQFGRREKAAEVSICEMEAARLSGDDLTLARSLISYGATLVFSGDVEDGLKYMEEARQAFSRGDSPEYRQGLGWYWILRADLANARVTDGGSEEALEAAAQAIAYLEPIENWPGIGRAWAARAIACEALGDLSGAESAYKAQAAAKARLHNA